MLKLYDIKLKRGIKYKILKVTDTHLIDEEFKNSVRYVESVEKFILGLIESAKRGDFNVLIFLGDLFDRPYKDVSKAYYHTILLEELHEILEGRIFKVVGNHPLNKKKAYVPTFFLIGEIKSGRIKKSNNLVQFSKDTVHLNYGLKRPIIYAPDRIHVNGSIINLFHFDKEDKNYFDDLSDLDYTPKYHLACYHDSIMTGKVKNVINYISNGNRFDIPSVDVVENTNIFSNVDYATIGDLHTAIGEFHVKNTLTGRVTIADIPGSVGRTANHKAQQHNTIYLPLFEIDEEGEVTKSHFKVDLLDWREVFKTLKQEEEKLDRKVMTDFKQVVDMLTLRDTFEETMEQSDLEERSKEIISEILSKGSATISYRDKAVEKGLLSKL